MGDVVEAPESSASDCCVGTEEGLSYGSPGDCTIPQCIGIIHFCVPICSLLLPSIHFLQSHMYSWLP